MPPVASTAFDWWNQRAGMLGSAVNDPRANGLGASDYNALRGDYQNAVNYRAAAVPGPWQASYYAPPTDTNLAAAIKLQAAGVGLNNDILAGAETGQRIANTGMSFPLQQAKLRQDLQNGAQTYSQQAGSFPLQQNQAAQTLLNTNTAGDQAKFSYFNDFVKSTGAPNAQQLLTTWNGDPAHPNQFRIEGEDVVDPITGQVVGKKPPAWRYVQPETIQAIMAHAPEGYTNGPSSMQNMARLQALEAERQAHIASTFNANDGAFQPVQQAGPQSYAQMGEAHRTAIDNGLSTLNNSLMALPFMVGQRAENYASAAGDYLRNFLFESKPIMDRQGRPIPR